MMTKHVPAATMKLYLHMMNMEHKAGRADVAQALHSMRKIGQVKHRKRGGASVSGVDSWEDGGDEGHWCRRHRTPRDSLFTPWRVPGGPTRGEKLQSIRVTEGIRLDNCREFTVKDDWRYSTSAHRKLGFQWVGKTTLIGAKVEIRDVQNSTCALDRVDSCENFLGTRATQFCYSDAYSVDNNGVSERPDERPLAP